MKAPEQAGAPAPPLDTIATHDTPEGVELRLELAGPMVRGIAWMLDLLLRQLLYLFCAATLAWWGGVGWGLLLLGLFFIEWFYPVFFEVFSGATPGKRLFGLEVVRDDGAPIDWTGSLLRNLLRVADFLPLFNALGLLCMLLHPRMQRLGDMAAGTLVVYRQVAPSRDHIPACPPLPATQPLLLAEQQLILDFCAREARLPPKRTEELAALLPALIQGRAPEKQLLALGNWLLHGGKPGASVPL